MGEYEIVFYGVYKPIIYPLPDTQAEDKTVLPSMLF